MADSGMRPRRLLVSPAAVIGIGLAALLAGVLFEVCATPDRAYATTASNGAHVYTLEEGVTYSPCDVTGDGKPDTIKVVLSGIENDRYSRIKVFVNGKTALNQKASGYRSYIEAQLIKLKNGKTFLYLFGPFENDDSDVCAVFRYSGGKFKMNIDCNKGLGKKIGSHVGGCVKEVSGNKVVMAFRAMSYMAGNIEADYTYKYKNGVLKRVSATGKLHVANWQSQKCKKGYAAKKNIAAYKSTSCKAKKFTIRKGQKVKFLKVHVKGNTVRFQVSVGGKIGWIKVANRYDSPLMYKNPRTWYEPPFKGLFLAG